MSIILVKTPCVFIQIVKFNTISSRKNHWIDVKFAEELEINGVLKPEEGNFYHTHPILLGILKLKDSTGNVEIISERTF